MATTTNVAPLKINYLTQAQYDTALANSQINSNELYFTPDAGVPWSDVTGKPSTATSWPTWAQILDGANSLAEGSSDLTDNSEILTSYASNNGFADTNAVGKVYKRDAIHMYNYIKGKLDSVYKAKQTAVTTATAGSGTTTTVVSSVTQDAQGVITVTTKSIPTYNNYSHPTGDGNLHVPATGTTNNGKFLKAGSTAGSLSWAALVADDIPNLAASKINSGTFDAARIPSLAASKINSGTFDAARIPTLSITDKTSGTLTVARGGTGVTSFTNDCVIVSTGTTQTLVNRGLKVTGATNANVVIQNNTSGKHLSINSPGGTADITINTAANSGTGLLYLSSGNTLYINKPTSASIIFTSGGADTSHENGRFNINGMFHLGEGGTQNTHRLYVNGDSAFNGKLVFGAQASNAITPKADIEYNATFKTIDFIVV